MEKSLNLNIVPQKLRSYRENMFKKFIIIFFLILIPITGCSTLSEVNERVKGDGIPYIPGI